MIGVESVGAGISLAVITIPSESSEH